MSNRKLTTREAADILSCSESHMRKLASVIPFERVGSSIMFAREDVESYRDSKGVRPTFREPGLSEAARDELLEVLKRRGITPSPASTKRLLGAIGAFILNDTEAESTLGELSFVLYSPKLIIESALDAALSASSGKA